MALVTVTRRIAAPPAVVFAGVAHVETLPSLLDMVEKIEFLTEQRTGVGTRFRETRRMGGRLDVTELEITEYDEGRSARMVADSHGTIWDTRFTVAPAADGAELTIEMEARAHAFLPRLLNPLMKGLFRKGLVQHVDALQAACERR